MIFDEMDDLLSIRLERHTEFHEKAQVQKRNTTQGTPKFNKISFNDENSLLITDGKRRSKR